MFHDNKVFVLIYDISYVYRCNILSFIYMFVDLYACMMNQASDRCRRLVLSHRGKSPPQQEKALFESTQYHQGIHKVIYLLIL